MKIFNLDTKKTLVVWSAILAVIVNLIMLIFLPYGKSCWAADWSGQPCLGWPAAINGVYFNDGGVKALIIDFIFWILVVFVILNLVRYFRKKNP